MRHTLFVGLMLCLILSGCFRTRDVEPPGQVSSDWVSPTDYTILLNNLERSVNQQNVQNYLRCFRDNGLRFIPSTPVYTGNEIIWDNWSWQDEQSWFNNVISDLGLSSGNQLDLEEIDLQTFDNDSIRYIANYDLIMNHTDTSLTVHFTGQLEFRMQVNTYNEWEITRWSDFETNKDSSWSRLKLNYVQ